MVGRGVGAEVTDSHEDELHGWWIDIVCQIGLTFAGSFYCVRVCDYHKGKCDSEASAEELAAYAEFRRTQPTKRRREER